MSSLNHETIDSRYLPIPQKKYLCVPACIQMVLQKHSLPIPSQDELGYHLGVVVPPEEARDFNPVRVGSGSEVGIGTQMLRPEYDFNTVAKRLSLGLGMTLVPPDSFGSPGEFTAFLAETEKADNDVVVCFDFTERYQIEGGGHVNLFDRVLPDNQVRLIEPMVTPGYEDYLWRETDATRLLQAMKVHTEWMGGIWEIQLH